MVVCLIDTYFEDAGGETREEACDAVLLVVFHFDRVLGCTGFLATVIAMTHPTIDHSTTQMGRDGLRTKSGTSELVARIKQNRRTIGGGFLRMHFC
jgi:hypothetical protein